MINLPSLVFGFFAVALVVLSLAVVLVRNIFHSALALVFALCVVAGFFALCGADFLASAQILVYVGGIMIILLFVVMFSQRPLDALQRQTNTQWLPSLFLSLVVGASLVRAFHQFEQRVSVPQMISPTSASVGRLLLGEMVLPFEVVSLVLLAALVGAILFGQDKMENLEK